MPARHGSPVHLFLFFCTSLAKLLDLKVIAFSKAAKASHLFLHATNPIYRFVFGFLLPLDCS